MPKRTFSAHISSIQILTAFFPMIHFKAFVSVMMTGFGLDDRRSISITTVSRPAQRPAQPPMEWVPGAFSPGVKRLEREADYLYPYSANVKNGAIVSSTCGQPNRLKCHHNPFEGPCWDPQFTWVMGLPVQKKNGISKILVPDPIAS
jgi:hypothetical protein